MRLPIDEFNGYLDEIVRMLKRESPAGSGTTDHRSLVEEQMRRLHG